eukprot:2109017-Rhodomonas_salina.1
MSGADAWPCPYQQQPQLERVATPPCFAFPARCPLARHSLISLISGPALTDSGSRCQGPRQGRGGAIDSAPAPLSH